MTITSICVGFCIAILLLLEEGVITWLTGLLDDTEEWMFMGWALNCLITAGLITYILIEKGVIE